MRHARALVTALAGLGIAASGLTISCPPPSGGGAPVALPGLEAEVRVVHDALGVPHIFAQSDFDGARVQGYVHARDRFWQMDTTRRQVDGTLAELLGPGSLGADIQARAIGLDVAAQRSAGLLQPRELEILEAYADGVNAWLDAVEASGQLPPEYAALELARVRRWTPVDTLMIGKAIATSLSLDIDAGRVEALEAYVSAGENATPPFDGEKLFFDDVRRVAPMDPASSVPDATGTTPFQTAERRRIDRSFLAKTVPAARRFRENASTVPFLAAAFDRKGTWVGSNHWGVTAAKSATGLPILANDPHLGLDFPATFYENHLVVTGDPVAGDLNVNGITFPGVPAVILGQNEHVTWGATTNPMDVSDLFRDKIVRGAAGCPTLWCIETGGAYHTVTLRLFTFQVNTPSDGQLDNLVDSGLPFEQSLFPQVPYRGFGPVVDIDDPSVFFAGGVTSTHALVLQFTGLHATREVETFLIWNRARNLDDFRRGLESFDFGSQNWLYADDQGNLAYFTSAELPLRVDLENGAVVGMPPSFVRDGESGQNDWVPNPTPPPGQAIPYEILPYAEMPQTVNPAHGFVANANNDPAGTSLDNDPLNQRRISKPSAIYYLNGGYSDGLRAGRITRLLRDRIAAGQKISVSDMKRFQGNTQELDAELLTPFVLAAFANAQRLGAPPALAALAAEAGVAEAVGRLASWDFSTPTGIPEGWDASDSNGVRLPVVPQSEARASVAATIFNLWRAKLIRGTIDARLAQLGVPGVGGGDALRALHHLLTRVPYTGVGASGVDFIPEPAALGAADRRDLAILSALRDALATLASNEFAPAFGNSTNQDDYRWGKLHRVTFSHALGGSFDVPPAGGFSDLAPGLPGLSRDGGYEVVNASGFNARSQTVNGFRFGGGPVRRYVGVGGGGAFPTARIAGWNVIPGGGPGDPAHPLALAQLPLWLTADHHEVLMFETEALRGASKVERFFAPAP
jgi:penicillin amidase